MFSGHAEGKEKDMDDDDKSTDQEDEDVVMKGEGEGLNEKDAEVYNEFYAKMQDGVSGRGRSWGVL